MPYTKNGYCVGALGTMTAALHATRALGKHGIFAEVIGLSANETKRGCAYLRAWQKAGGEDPAVITKPADAPAGRQRELGEDADALYTLCLPTATDAGAMIRRSPFIQG